MKNRVVQLGRYVSLAESAEKKISSSMDGIANFILLIFKVKG